MPDTKQASATSSRRGSLGYTGNTEKWRGLRKFTFSLDDFIHRNEGPWPQPAPDNPSGQIAQVIHLPQSELDDWKKNVSNKYLRIALTRWPEALLYIWRNKHYVQYDDARFNEELTEGFNSKFISPLDEGDMDRFKGKLPAPIDAAKAYKADFSCMEPMSGDGACYDGMHAAATITLLEKTSSEAPGQKYQARAIYIYRVRETGELIESHVFTPTDGDHWELAKYFVLQGAVHRINLTQHALLHFPFDSINAITRTVLPTNHLVFRLLFPHLRLSLPVNKAVLENPGSLINRDKRMFYSPFCAPGATVRKLLPDGYIGRDKKPNAYPVYSFRRGPLPEPQIPDSEYGEYLNRYYAVFDRFVGRALTLLNDKDERSWTLIGLWAECISEWIPDFPSRDELIDDDDRPVAGAKRLLHKTLALIMWDLSVAHGADHIVIHSKRPVGNPFRLRVPPPGHALIDPGWRNKLVNRWDLFSSWFTDALFYEPHNVELLLEPDRRFDKGDPDQPDLTALRDGLITDLRDCEAQMMKDGVYRFARLEQIPTSIQY